MSAVLCSQCSAPLPMEAAQGRAPCGFCGAVNAPSLNPYAPQTFAQAPTAAVSSGTQPRVCPACRLDNAPHTTFCRGCGGVLSPEAINAPPAQMFAQGPRVPSTSEPVGHAWVCHACRHENQARYQFCLGCGGARREGGGAPVEREYGHAGNPYPRQRSPMVLIAVVVAIVIAGAIAGVAAMILA